MPAPLQQEIDLNVMFTEITTILFLDTLHLIRSCLFHISFHHKIIQNLPFNRLKQNVLLIKIHHLTRRTTRKKILSLI